MLGLVLLLAAAAFLWQSYSGQGHPISGGVLTVFLVAVAALVTAELLPHLQSLKFGASGVELSLRDLGESLTSDIASLKARLGELELRATMAPVPEEASTLVGGAGTTAKYELVGPPSDVDQPGSVPDDPRKGRFGGRAERDGFRLRAEFLGPFDRDWTKVRLIVEPSPRAGQAVPDVLAVEFFLHDSFNRARIRSPATGGVARLTITVWGGFTVGVWVYGPQTALELDLATIQGAPRVIREL
jgi:hypothetical protein